MRRSGEALSSPHHASGSQPARSDRSDWATLRRLFPYLWHYKWRVMAALAFMIGAKVANVGVPVLLKNLVDAMSIKPGSAAALLVVPVGLLVAYGLLRLSTAVFNELRELVFAKATEGAARSISLEVFRAPARAEPALSPGATDRRHDARHRARHARRALADLDVALQHRADASSSSRWC